MSNKPMTRTEWMTFLQKAVDDFNSKVDPSPEEMDMVLHKATAELRRLHAEVEALRSLARAIIAADDAGDDFPHRWYSLLEQAHAAIDAARNASE